MALVLADRVRETTTTTGTGAVTLAGPYSGFQAFSVIGNGNTTYYAISDPNTGAWEVGIGTYTSSGNTLSRDTVLSSTNTGSLVNFASGVKDVICTQPSERNVYVVGTSVVAANSATVPNSLLANSAVTIGSTSVSLGGTATTVAGLTLTGAAVNGTVGATTPAAGTFTDLTANTSFTAATADINGGTIDNTAIGSSTASTGAFTSVTATLDSTFSSTGALQISAGTTAQRPTGAVGKIRWNSTLNQYEGFDGTNWTLLGGAVISNDTATASNLYPTFAGVTSGNVSTLYTGNAKLLYKPSTGELQSTALVASNGIVVNSATVSSDYTVPSGSNAMSAGPITVASGVTVTVSSGSVWTTV